MSKYIGSQWLRTQYYAITVRHTLSRGVVAVEFALLFPILTAIFFSVIEWGFVMYDKAVITNAAREGARFGIGFNLPRNTQAQIQTATTNACTGALLTMGGSISCAATATLLGTGTFAAPAVGDRLSVTVTTTYNGTALLALYNMLVGPIVLTETAVMRYE